MTNLFLFAGLAIFLSWLIIYYLKTKDTIKWCDWIAENGVILIAFIIPLYFDIHLYSTFDLSKVGLMYILSLIILLAWLIKMVLTQNYKSISTPINLAVLGFFASMIISTVFSMNPMMSLIGTYKRYEGLTAITCYIIQFFVIINFINTKLKLYRLIKAIIYAGLASSCYGMIQHFGKDPLSWESWNPWRIIANFGNPVFYSAYAEMVILVGLGMYLYVQGTESRGKKVMGMPSKPTVKIKKKKKKIAEKPDNVNLPSDNQMALLWRWIYAIKTGIVMIYFATHFNTISAPITLGEPNPSFWVAYSPLMMWLTYIIISIIFLSISFTKEKNPFWLLIYELCLFIGFFSFNFFEVSIQYWAVLVCYLLVCLGYIIFITLPISSFGIPFIYGSIVCLTFYGFCHCNTRGAYIGLFLGLLFFLIMIISNKQIVKYKNRLIPLGIALLLIFIKFNFLIPETSVITRFTTELFSLGKPKTTIEEKINTEKKEPIPEKTFYPQPVPRKVDLPIPGITATFLTYEHLEIKTVLGPKVVIKLPWRAYIWGSVIANMKDDLTCFLVGAGPDTMGFIFPKYVYSILPPEVKGPVEFEDRAHNDICDTLSARGTIGLVIYAWLILAFFLTGIRYYLKTEGHGKFIILGLMCSVLGFLGQNLVSFGVTPLSSGFWILLGTTMAGGRIFLQAQTQQPDKYQEQKIQLKNQSTKLILSFTIIGIIILLIYLTVRTYKADNLYKNGTVWLHRGDMDNAIAMYEQAIKLHPYEVRYRDECNRLYVEKARNTYDPVWIQKANKGAHELLELTSYKHSNAYFTLAIAKYIEGAKTGQESLINEAIKFYKKAVSINPFLADAYNNLGVIYTQRNMLDEAAAVFKLAYRLNTNHIGALENLTRIFLNKQDYENAALVFEEILSSHPKYKTQEILNALGMIYANSGQIDKVITKCKKIIELDPTNTIAYENLGYMYYQQGNLKEAKELFNKILQLDPNNAKAMQMLRAISLSR
ncbi:MAG: tetratricopeptide repeat protein [bacterium]|nr:tetratricopeptide repeat protein [bacterium]